MTRVPRNGLLDAVPPEAVERARWWEQQILDVLGCPAEEGVDRAGPDPGLTSVAQREEAKAAELTAAGYPVTARAIRDRRYRYTAAGLPGCYVWGSLAPSPTERIVACVDGSRGWLPSPLVPARPGLGGNVERHASQPQASAGRSTGR